MGGQRAPALFPTLSGMIIIIIIIIRTCVRRGKENIFNSVRCILIISPIIMDRFPCAPNDNGVWTLQPQQQYHHGEGIEELKHLLFCATLELERARANAESQSQLQEAKLRHLQELLTVACRERDEAREQLLQLNHRLAEYSMLTNTQHHVTSSDRSPWPDTRLAVTEATELNPSSSTTTTTTTSTAMHSNSSQLFGLGDQFHWNSGGHDFDFLHLDLRADVHLHQPQPQPQPPTSSSKVHCSNLMELQEQPFYHQKEQQLSFVEPEAQQQHRHRVESYRPPLVDDKSTDYDFWQQDAAVAGIRQPSNPFLAILEPSAHGHMTYQDPKPDLLHTSPASILDSTSPTMPTHLPEPPESDLQVMLSALPERGKLLQAVVQAGPLLQTLLLAGPLPQWIYPPPALDTTEIPTISMSLSANSLPLGPMVHHVPSPNIPTSALDPLQVNSPGSSSHQSLSPCTRINEPHTSFITSLQSTSAAASSSSKFLCAPMFNSQDSTITAGPPLKFAKIH